MKQKPSMKEMMEKIKARRANPAQVNDDASEIVPPSADDGDDDHQSMAQPVDDKEKEIAPRPAIATDIKPKKSKTMKDYLTEKLEREQRSAMRNALGKKSQEANQAQENQQADNGVSEIAPPSADDEVGDEDDDNQHLPQANDEQQADRKSTRLNSSHTVIS